MTIDRVGIIGGGMMGSGIAEVCALAGSKVLVHEVDRDAADAARRRIVSSMTKAVERGKLDEQTKEEALARISLSIDLSDQADRELVIEAATENEQVKTQIFADLDRIVADHRAILASNTSSIPITRLASVTERPHSVVGMHFFNPVPVMALVELVTTVVSDPDVADRAQAYAEAVGKTVIRAKDRAGFVVNMLLVPYMLGAIRMYETGFSSREDIDNAMKLGANHPMGPLELADFVGLDTTKYIADVLFEEYREPMYASPPLLTRMVEAGLHGRKTGRGFYDYR